MSEGNHFIEPKPMTPDQVMAELFRENERLRRQVEDIQRERDFFKQLYNSEAAKNDPELTAEDIASAIPARPYLEQLIATLEQP
jgi:hypothetical protein